MSALDHDPAFASGSLLQQLKSKHPAERDQAWEYLYKVCYPMVRDSICRNTGTSEDAVDIFQDGLLILHRNLNKGTYRAQSSIKTYIFGICRNLWLKELRKRRRHQPFPEDIEIPEQVEVREYLINVEIITLLMSELKEDCHRILIEFYFNNRSMAELKEMFNVNSVQAAKNKKLRCLSYLVRLCRERGVLGNISL